MWPAIKSGTLKIRLHIIRMLQIEGERETEIELNMDTYALYYMYCGLGYRKRWEKGNSVVNWIHAYCVMVGGPSES